ncbi:MAG: hypothetical protein HZA22_06120 [Nitrospirae bacterium]|nr:hypothetical protein [Nitrospirota bacterium]MBI5694689.1 hypothetical protein [Nitrospirota bacterium]
MPDDEHPAPATARERELEQEVERLKEEVLRLRGVLASHCDTVLDMLKRRGFTLHKKERDWDLVLPDAESGFPADEYYRLMNRYSFRLFVRDVITHQDGFIPEGLVRFSGIETVTEYTEFLLRAGILETAPGGVFRMRRRPVRSFGPTLEWYVAEVLRREYAADALWGASFKGNGAGGDYDVLASFEGRLLYAEVKSSPPKQIYDTEVRAYIERFMELSPDVSLFVMDTELRMKDKVVFLFEQVMPDTKLAGMTVERLEAELFHIGGRIFIVNSKGGLAANIGTAIGAYLKRSQHDRRH